MEPTANAVLLESDTNELEIVEFRVDEVDASGTVIPCYYGVNVAKVREIIRLPHLWKSFHSHAAVEGMIQLRDQVIAVINLATLLNKSADGIDPDRVIVLEFNRMKVGVLVHSVSRIYRISWEQVEPPGPMVSCTQITGLVKMADRIILVLDFEKIIGELAGSSLFFALDEKLLSGQESQDRTTRRILVADDSPFIRNTMCSKLRGAGYQVEEASNGEEAWDLLAAKLERCKATGCSLSDEVSLLITDVEMPKMDGLHLTSRVKKTADLSQLPVVIFSSLASEDNIRKWHSLGADGIITKPDLPNLVSVADRLLFGSEQTIL